MVCCPQAAQYIALHQLGTRADRTLWGGGKGGGYISTWYICGPLRLMAVVSHRCFPGSL